MFVGGIRKDVPQDWLLRRLKKEVVGVEEVEVPMARSFPLPLQPFHLRELAHASLSPGGVSLAHASPRRSAPSLGALLTVRACPLCSLQFAEPDRAHENKGFAFVSFYNNQCASKAYDKLSRQARIRTRTATLARAAGSPSSRADACGVLLRPRHARTQAFLIAGRHPTVKWAEPRKGPTEAENFAAQNVKNIYVTGFTDGTTQEQLEEAFTKFGEIERVYLHRPKPDDRRPGKLYAFVHFKERAAACLAADSAEKPEVNGNRCGTFSPADSSESAASLASQKSA